MPIGDFFQNQFDLLRDFMETPDGVVRCVRIDPDIKEIFLKALVKMEDDPEYNHMVIPCDSSFESPSQFFAALYDTVVNEYKKYADELKDAGIALQTSHDKYTQLDIGLKFVQSVSKLSDSLPHSMGSVVILLDPEEVSDTKAYGQTIKYLAENTESVWVKYLILDQRVSPVLEGIEKECERTSVQVFFISPEGIEESIKRDLENPAGLFPVERRQYIGLLAGFAFGRKEYDEAARLQLKWIAECEEDGSPQEVANAYYSLANTQLAQGDYQAAEKNYCNAIELCLDHEVNTLTPLLVTNLGVALHRQQRVDEAINCFEVARNAFKAQNQLPGEAHVLDCLAAMYHAEDRNDEAEAAWLEALSLYNGITSSVFADVKDAGQKDLIAKLERLYRTTGQENKIDNLKRISGGQ